MKLRPLGSRVLVKLDPRKQVTDGGIHVPDKYQPSPLWGEVIAVGDGKWLSGKNGWYRDPAIQEFEVGMRVLVGPWNGLNLSPLVGAKGLAHLGIESARDQDAGYWLMDVSGDKEFPDVYGIANEGNGK